jgi:hypothetical protein
MPAPARTVVYRHPCDCAAASRPLAEGEHPEHRFDVDDKPFPWHLTEAGPSFVKWSEHLYVVSVNIIPMLRDANARPHTADFSHHIADQPVICGVEFPWMITEHGFTYRSSQQRTVLYLAFEAESVDVDCPIPQVAHGTA